MNKLEAYFKLQKCLLYKGKLAFYWEDVALVQEWSSQYSKSDNKEDMYSKRWLDLKIEKLIRKLND